MNSVIKFTFLSLRPNTTYTKDNRSWIMKTSINYHRFHIFIDQLGNYLDKHFNCKYEQRNKIYLVFWVLESPVRLGLSFPSAEKRYLSCSLIVCITI